MTDKMANILEEKSMWIITEENVADEQDNLETEAGDDFSAKLKSISQRTSVSIDDLKENISDFCDTVEELFKEAEKSMLGILLDEIELFIKIDHKGQISLLSTSQEEEIKGAIKLKFKRHDIKLNSEQGIDYQKLRDLLALEKWQEADTETNNLMCQIVHRTEDGWLRAEDLREFPSEELQAINKLWLHYSRRKFGFSVQAKIYRSLGGTEHYTQDLWEKFGEKVGWRKNGKWLEWEDYNFEIIKNTPRGHLPTPGGMGGGIGGLVTLLSRNDL
jgi:hypothetical protein